MADEIKVKMSEFAEATQINNADEIIILQNGENKKVKSPILESKVINRTVEELSKNGGVALNLVNLKGVVATYANLPTTGLQINDAYQVTADGLVYTWNGTSFQANGQGFKVQPDVNGVVAQGNDNAVSGGEVWKQNNLSLNNLSINGNFDDSLTNWSVGSDIIDARVDEGVLKFTGKGGVSSNGTRISQTSLPNNSDIVFIRVVARITSNIGTSGYLQIGRGGTTSGVQFSLTNEFKPYYINNNTSSNILKFSGGINALLEVSNVAAYNLTSIFGVGKEPSADEFELLLNAGNDFVQSKIIDVRKIALDSSKKADLGYSIGETIKNLKQVEYQTNLTLTNLNTLGDFTSTLNWTVGANITNSLISNGTYKFTGAGLPSSNETQVYRIFSSIPNENKVFISIVAKSNNNATLIFGRGLTSPYQYEKLSSNYIRVGGVFDTASTRFKIGANLGGNVEVDSISIVDLTATFGAGKEPSAEYMIQLLNITGYFESDKLIDNKELRIGTELEIKSLYNTIKPKLKVLLIGSSHGMDTIMSFPSLAYLGGVDIICGNLYSGGNDIVDVADKIRNNTDFAQYALHFGNTAWIKQNVGVVGGRTFDVGVKAYDWDVIIVQRGAFQSATWTQEQRDAMFFVLNHINSITYNNPQIIFNSGFSLPINTATNYTRQDQIDRTLLINTTAEEAQNDLFFDVLPTNTAVQNARNTFLKNYGTWTDKDIARDETHLDSGIGTYITGCVLFEKLITPRFNISIRNMNSIPPRSRVDGLINTVPNFTPVTEEMSKLAKLCALSAVLKPFELSETLPINFP